MSYVNKVKLLLKCTSGVPPVTFYSYLHSPTLCTKGTKTPHKEQHFPISWHHISYTLQANRTSEVVYLYLHVRHLRLQRGGGECKWVQESSSECKGIQRIARGGMGLQGGARFSEMKHCMLHGLNLSLLATYHPTAKCLAYIVDCEFSVICIF